MNIPRVNSGAHWYKSKAREHWAKAKQMVEEMGYLRRDKEIAELAEQLEAS